MDLGEKLRTLRRQSDLTQPDLAEALGIEQSYLSKLENGKSIPSGDVFDRILSTFHLEVGDIVDDLDQGSRSQLRHIPAVARHFDEQKRLLIGNRRRWLMASSVFLAIGVALIYAGVVHLFVPDRVYTYKSDGIVLEGESKEALLGFGDSGLDADERRARLMEDYLTTRDFRGQLFNIPVEGGSRTYFMRSQLQDEPWVNKAISTLGAFLSVLGATGLVLEKKLSRFQ